MAPTMPCNKLKDNQAVFKLRKTQPASHEIAQTHATPRKSRPLKSALAFALLIAKSKPEHLSITEYMIQRRKYLRTGKLSPSIDQSHIDSTSYWKDECSRLSLENADLKKEIAHYKLLADVDSVRDAAQVLVEEINSNQGYRGCRDQEIKGGRNNAGVSSSAMDTVVKFINCLPLIKQSQELHNLSKDDSTTLETLSATLETTLKYMSDVVCQTVHTQQSALAHGDETFSKHITLSLQLVGGAFNICLHALKQLSSTIIGRQRNGPAISKLTSFFVNVLDQMQISCRRPDSATSTLLDLVQASEDMDNKRQIVLKGLSNLLITMLASPAFDIEKTAHCDVLEFFWSKLLRRVGELLSQNVFGERISDSANPGGISMQKSPLLQPTEATITLKLEGSYLGDILRRSLDVNSNTSTGRLTRVLVGGGSRPANATQNVLLSQAREKLQHTLLQGVFGSDCGSFLSALRLPKESQEFWKNNSLPELERENNLLEEVWLAIGWDLICDS